MAKNKNNLGKLVAFTTAVAAIGGTCYVFRDKIKAHPLYGKSKDKLTDLYCKISDKFMNDFDDDDFFDDDFEGSFPTEKSREYTSITINSKSDDDDDFFEDEDDFEDDEEDIDEEDEDTDEEDEEDNVDDDDNDEEKASDTDDATDEDSIPIISFDKARSDSNQDASAYENEGLSDVSEDPDTLEEQDKLDF